VKSARTAQHPSALTMIESVVVVSVIAAGIAAVVLCRQWVHEYTKREYNAGFIAGLEYVVQTPRDLGMRCWMDDKPYNRGYDHACALVGNRIDSRRAMSRHPMAFRDRVELAQDVICREDSIDLELQLAAIKRLNELHQSQDEVDHNFEGVAQPATSARIINSGRKIRHAL